MHCQVKWHLIRGAIIFLNIISEMPETIEKTDDLLYNKDKYYLSIDNYSYDMRYWINEEKNFK